MDNRLLNGSIRGFDSHPGLYVLEAQLDERLPPKEKVPSSNLGQDIAVTTMLFDV